MTSEEEDDEEEDEEEEDVVPAKAFSSEGGHPTMHAHRSGMYA